MSTPRNRFLTTNSFTILSKRGETMDNLYQNIGKRMSQLRKSRGITQEKLAEELDITIKHVSSVERGMSSLSLEKMIEICRIFDCTLDYLILGENSNNLLTKLPPSILNILNSNNNDEISLLLDYMNLYIRLRQNIK